jgi:transcriptional regulator with XRE-family HTH domain
MATRARKLDKSVHSGGQDAFCELMVRARKAAGLTQRELADRLHKPQSFVAKYEGGKRRIDVLKLLTVSQAIGADPAKLLKAEKRDCYGQPESLMARRPFNRHACRLNQAKVHK